MDMVTSQEDIPVSVLPILLTMDPLALNWTIIDSLESSSNSIEQSNVIGICNALSTWSQESIKEPKFAEDDVSVSMPGASIRKHVVMDVMATLFRIEDDRISTMALLFAAGMVTCFVKVSELELFIRESNMNGENSTLICTLYM
jgi:hypothetical protein